MAEHDTNIPAHPGNVFPRFAASNVVAFPKTHRHRDPLIRENLDHAYIAMHVAAQYDEDHIEGFISELIADDRAGDIADVLKNNARAIRWLMAATNFMIDADAAISAAADRFLAEALVTEGGEHA